MAKRKSPPKPKPKKRKKRAQAPLPPPVPPTPPPAPPPPEPNPDNPSRQPLTPEEQAFVIEYLRCFRVGQAYRTVHPHVTRMSARNLGSRLYARVHVREEIEAEMSERRHRSRVKADRVVKAAYQLLMADIADCYDQHNNLKPVRDIPLETRRWVQSLEDTDRDVTMGSGPNMRTIYERHRKCRLVNKSMAFALLAKHLGLDDRIPPIEIVLAMLPKEAAGILRELLKAPNSPIQVQETHPAPTPIEEAKRDGQ